MNRLSRQQKKTLRGFVGAPHESDRDTWVASSVAAAIAERNRIKAEHGQLLAVLREVERLIDAGLLVPDETLALRVKEARGVIRAGRRRIASPEQWPEEGWPLR